MRKALPIFVAVGRMFSISPLKTMSSNALFDLVVELVTVVAEELYSVVFVGVVRGRQNNSRVRAKRSGDTNTRRGQRTDDQDIDAQGGDARHHGVLQHVAGKPCVFAQHDLAPVGSVMRIPYRAEDMRGGTPQLKGSFRGDGFDVCHAPDTVRSKKPSLCRHVLGFESLEGGAPCSSRCGFFSTFLLMKYHSAHARRRQVTFGLQSFVSVSLIIFIVKQQLAEAAAEFVNA